MSSLHTQPQPPSHELIQHHVASASTSLREVFDCFVKDGHPYRLVKNEEGHIDGIVDMRRIQKLLSTDCPVERVRWEQVPVGTIAETIFALPTNGALPGQSSGPAAEDVSAVHVYDDAGCVAVISKGETYVSWTRISAAMLQNHLDPVTHLPPRISFNRRLREEIDRAARCQQALGVLMIDLDNFKMINDQLGHSAGDMALRMVADRLCSGIRSYDFVARFGGDEFTVICYDCKPSDIHLPVGRLQNAVADLPSLCGPNSPKIGISIGAAVMAHIDEHCPLEVIVEQADGCLYDAKRSGRFTAFAIELDPFGIPLSPAREIRPR